MVVTVTPKVSAAFFTLVILIESSIKSVAVLCANGLCSTTGSALSGIVAGLVTVSVIDFRLDIVALCLLRLY
jgi:hypothetical protein